MLFAREFMNICLFALFIMEYTTCFEILTANWFMCKNTRIFYRAVVIFILLDIYCGRS